MRKLLTILVPCVFSLTLFVLLMPFLAWAHGFAGKRFFPTTLSVDDPFISDELSFLFNYINSPDGKTAEFSIDVSKRILPNFGIEIGDAFQFVKPEGEKTQHGFSNLEVGAKYQFLTNAPHEAILSIGLSAEFGHTGNSSVGADEFSTISPAFFFGKGFGDLPEVLKYLRPLAITGVIGPNFPTSGETVNTNVNPDTEEIEQDVEQNPVTLSYGFTIQYNLQYLQSFVKDVGLPVPLNRMIVVTEFPFETDLNRGSGGDTTGFVNPGLIWFGKYIELGIEAQIPLNERTGDHVGVLALIHFFIDDLFPNSLGRPIFH
jgi:hypothetical protein